MATVLIVLPSIVTILLAVLVVGLLFLAVLIHVHDNQPSTYGVKLTASQKITLRAVRDAQRDIARIEHKMDKLNKSSARYDSLLYPVVQEKLQALQHSHDVLTDYVNNVQLV